MSKHDFIPLVTFRGWSKVEVDFVYGHYVYSENINKHYIVQDAVLSNTKIGSISFSHFFEVDKDSLGIYTGEDDKHGNPIFCGVAGAKYGSDIAKMWNGNKSQIRYTRSVFHTGKLDYKFSQIIRPGALEVIGNQYEQHLKDQK